jgi:flagellar basal body rod protein FlgC
VRFLGTEVQRGVDVDAVTEMVAVLNAQRAFEANASVFDLGKRLAERTIEVGRS